MKLLSLAQIPLAEGYAFFFFNGALNPIPSVVKQCILLSHMI